MLRAVAELLFSLDKTFSVRLFGAAELSALLGACVMRAFPSFGFPLTASLKGKIPSPIDLPAGCRFASRCPHAVPFCLTSDSVLKHPEDADPNATRRVACHFLIRDILEP